MAVHQGITQSNLRAVVAKVDNLAIAAPTIKTAAYTVADSDSSLIFNGGAQITVTLPSASLWSGRVLWVKTIAAFAVISASSNVKPVNSNTAGTAILAGTAGTWAMLVSDGTNWVIMAS